MSRDEENKTLYQRLGYGGDPRRLDAVLERAGLTGHDKPRISLDKEELVSIGVQSPPRRGSISHADYG